MAKMRPQATVAAPESQAAQPPSQITTDIVLQNNAHVRVRLVDVEIPDSQDPLATLEMTVFLVIMALLAIPVILVAQEIMVHKATQVAPDAQEPPDNYKE